LAPSGLAVAFSFFLFPFSFSLFTFAFPCPPNILDPGRQILGGPDGIRPVICHELLSIQRFSHGIRPRSGGAPLAAGHSSQSTFLSFLGGQQA
jgi:hypothetical protein